jgi:hypothetical protein
VKSSSDKKKFNLTPFIKKKLRPLFLLLPLQGSLQGGVLKV